MSETSNNVRTDGQIEVLPMPWPAVVPLPQLMGILRSCAGELGISPQVLRSLEVMLACLAPKRNHHTVFASNATLVERAGGLSERTLRRHIAQLVELGFIERFDSPNGKRYLCHDPIEAMTLRFGLDFTPLFARLPILEVMAQECDALRQQNHFLRRKLRAACHRLLQQEPDNSFALAAVKAARRNLKNEELQSLLDHLPSLKAVETQIETPKMAVNGGQNDRHHSNLNTELLDKECKEQLQTLIEHCPEAQSYALSPIHNSLDVIALAQSLAPMIGIKPEVFDKAIKRHQPFDVAALIWFIIEKMQNITKPAAYFYAVTLGAKAGNLNPWIWLERRSSQNCPRTTVFGQ